MKIIISLIITCLTITVKAQQGAYALPPKTANCGGFIIDSAVSNKSLAGKTLIYGNVSRCFDRAKGAGSIIEILDNNTSKILDTCYADVNGDFKIIVAAGSYKIWAARIGLGDIRTNTIDLEAQTSVKITFYLSNPPDIIDR